jgi:integrase/recombinase XerD
MASVKLKYLDDKVLKDETHPIAIQVILNRKKKLFYLGHSLSKTDWDYKNNQPSTKNQNYRLLRLRIKTALNELESIILDLENNQVPFSLMDVENKFKPNQNELPSLTTLVALFDKVIHELKDEKRIGNAKAYNNAKTIFVKLMGENYSICDVSDEVVNVFIHKMTAQGLSVNSRGVHLRALRALINKAIKIGIYDEPKYPFKNITIRTQKTRKRAVNKDVIHMVEEIDVSKENNLQLYKDLFMFSFYCRGMNFVDLAYLQVKNIEGERLNYRRQKTGQQFTVKMTDKAKVIVNRYSDLKISNAYIFPIIFRVGNEYLDYKNALRLMNKKLKRISELLNLDSALSTYVSRHSWATIAKRSGISTSVISEGMGHVTELITQVYLDSFENDVLDNANDLITNLD